eukprot:GHRQ01001621.1.p1 GENE.GHRQ01001621.1~~GHRQ01001621.1.p1  ORF type:complete len:266 (+),score=96.33 GHRQ01001621.1:215-1012(+)
MALRTSRPFTTQSVSGIKNALPALRTKRSLTCRAQAVSGRELAQRAAAAGAAVLLSAGMAAPALATEFDILGEPTPTKAYFVDDASVLSKSTRSALNKKLGILETVTGYRVEVVTVRKLEFETDAFAFADKVVDNWYPGDAKKDKGVLLMVTAGKEGAVTGGEGFVSAVGDDLIDSISGDNIPIFAEEERYNQAVLSSVDRLEAQLNGQPVPEAPKRQDNVRQRTYKTKEETEKGKTVTSTVVLSLLLIACIVPMLQYYGYTARD